MPIVAGKEYPYTREGIAAANLAQAGRNEDNALLGGEVAHISRAEGDLLKSLGGAGTINPVTGLRQYETGTASPGPGSMGAFGQAAAAAASPGTTGIGQSGGAWRYGLPPGFGTVYGMPVYTAHPAIAQQHSGRTLAEKVSNYQQEQTKKARQRLPSPPPVTPSTPSVVLADLAGSEALAASSLDPFSFSPATLSTDENVLVPFDAALGTLPVGDQAPTLVPSVLEEPDVFNPQTGFVEPEPISANEGGAVMPGLGFRPLGYSTGTGPRGVEDDYIGNVISEFNNLFTNNRISEVIELVNANPEVFFARGLDPRVAGIVQNLVDQELVSLPPTADQITAETEAFEASQAQDPESPIGAVGMPSPWNMGFIADSTVSPGEYTYADPGPWYETGGRLEDVGKNRLLSDVGAESNRNLGRIAGAGAGMDMPYPVEETVTETEPTAGYPGLQAGGHVGRGTMAGELGRRGDLSVRQAGETMFERMKRLRGYAGGGYASRGTVAGELPHHGDMSVREEGESMGELHKRHRDQDWYNRMGGGLGSLSRRRGIA